MEHIILCEDKEEFLHVSELLEMEVSKAACFEKGDVLYFSYRHMVSCFDVVSVLPNCVYDYLVHLCLVPALLDDQIKHDIANR